jgi:Ribbon-helix-helix protein, copG family
MYIMKRTQLYLDDDLWKALHIQSRQSRTSVSELVRQAVRERYASASARRKQAMEAWVGVWNGRDDLADSAAYIRRLRKGQRLARIAR